MALPQDVREFADTLLSKIHNTEYEDSLKELKKAVSHIWSIETPRIIRDFTDHGMDHCHRLEEYAFRILNAHDGCSLSPEKLYILFAGIYLHDIGMQCDVVKFPEVRIKAEEMGAVFDVMFSTRQSSNFTIGEQKAIRKNHQYLSAAWIDFELHNAKTNLSHAVKTIPGHLIADLLDVIKYHSKLPISECPRTYRLDPNQRKQLIAAILRFADELDIEGNRVNINTVKTFNLDPINEAYWWIHNITKIHFIGKNIILLKIHLNYDDRIELGSYVHTAFITQFQSKNLPVIKILQQNNIPIAIGAESGIEEYEYSDSIPARIKKALLKGDTPADSLSQLANEITTWLHAIKYEITHQGKNKDRIIELKATLDQGSIKQKVLIHCIGGEIDNEDVKRLAKKLNISIPQGWLISDYRISESARLSAEKEENIQIFRFSEFLAQMIWGPYFDSVKALVENSKIDKLYIDIGCFKQYPGNSKEEKKEEYKSLDTYIDSWLKERGKMHISMLGEFGSGKTWFSRHYTYRQLMKYLENPANERLPLLITLRAYAKSMSAEQLINDTLLQQYNLPFVGSAFDIFQEMNKQGKLLLILDGFDEMARQVDYQTVVDNFWELAKLIDEKSKVILTSRMEYFRWAKESQKILGGKEYGRRTILLTPPRFEVLYLNQFTGEQIKAVILNRLGHKEGNKVADKILKNKNLAEMAQKPVLVELLLAALDEKNEEFLQNQAQVYLYATNKLILRNINSQRTFTTTADKLYFLCELAWEMIKTGDLRIHYKDIPQRIKECFGEKIKDQHELDTWDFDLRAQTFLHRNAAGYYEFAHKSLAEYFVALKFGAEIGCLAEEYITTYCEEDGISCKLMIGEKKPAYLKETFGSICFQEAQMKAIRDFLVEMIDGSIAERLWQIIDNTRGKTTNEVQYNGGNAATLLNMKEVAFAERDLSDTILKGANLQMCDLTRTKLNSCNLDKANLAYSLFEKNFFNLIHFNEIYLTVHYKMKSRKITSKIHKKIFELEKACDIANKVHFLYQGSHQVFNNLFSIHFKIYLIDVKYRLNWDYMKNKILNLLKWDFIAFYADEIIDSNYLKFMEKYKFIFKIH